MSETCALCKAKADEHPYVGVGRGFVGGRLAGPFKAYPVCTPCWADPSHRKTRSKAMRKLHFFPRDQTDYAVKLAGGRAIVG